jgi:hypothetical protein
MTLAKLSLKINQIYKIGISLRNAFNNIDITNVYNHCCDRVCDVLIFSACRWQLKPHQLCVDKPFKCARDDWLHLGFHQYSCNWHLANVSAYSINEEEERTMT